MAIKRNLIITSENPHRTATVTLSYMGNIDWSSLESRDPDTHLHNWLRKQLAELGDTEISATRTRKFRVFMGSGMYETRTITAVFSVASKVKAGNTKEIASDKPFGKSYLASHIHATLKATAKNIATDSELSKLSAEIATMQSKLKELENRKAEMEKNRKVATNEHDAFTHIGKLLENAFGIGYKFVGAKDEKFCKVLKFTAYGESKELPISVYMVNEKVTKEHNVRSTSAVVPMPIIHVMNEKNIMVPISDLTPEEIRNLLR